MDQFADFDVDEFFRQNPDLLDTDDETGNGLTIDTGAQTLFPSGPSNDGTPLQQPAYTMPQPVASTAPMVQQPMMANGPCYHPMVGWYYPVVETNTVPPPPHLLPNTTLTPTMPTPIAGVSAPLPAPSNMIAATPVAPAALPRTRSQTKRKYGPSAYLDARARGRTSLSTEEANFFASSAARRDAQPTKSDSFDDSFSRIKTRPSIVQACVCGNQEAERVKRPKNVFMLYRLAKAPEIAKQLGTKHMGQVSKAAAKAWKNATPEVVERYQQLAEEEKLRHARNNPDYKYKPGGQTRARFGEPDCTCGAYQLNMARYREKKAARVASAGRQRVLVQERVEIAQGIPTAGTKRSREEAEPVDEKQQPGPKRRRSTRLRSSIVAATFDENHAFDFELYDFDGPATTPSPTALAHWTASPTKLWGFPEGDTPGITAGTCKSSGRRRSVRRASRESQYGTADRRDSEGRRRSSRLSGGK